MSGKKFPCTLADSLMVDLRRAFVTVRNAKLYV